MRPSTFATLLLAMAPRAALAQETVLSKPSNRVRTTTVGLEVDALPFISGGYYGSAWLGNKRVRLRGIVTQTTLPSFLVEDGFENADLDVYAVIADYIPRDGFRGLWVGAGIEYWRNTIDNEINGATAGWDNTVATLGAGYIWKFAGNFYLNPWAAAHLIVAGHTDVSVGGASYNPKRFTPEASLKLGWHY